VAFFMASFNSGTWYNIEYRQPRLLRISAVEMGAIKSSKQKVKPGEVLLLPSITGLHILNVARDVLMGPPEIKSDFDLLAKAFVEDAKNRETDSSLSILSQGRGHLLNTTAESILGVDRMKRLREWGYISLINGIIQAEVSH
jgi:hypothetical protein